MIRATRDITLGEDELEVRFVLASGPGGQNVNKAATAAQLRFDAARSPSLPEDVRARLLKLAGKRATKEGTVVITARRYRSQERNRQDAIDRLVALIRKAAVKPKPRRKKKASPAAKRKRLEEKRRRSERKRMREPVKGGGE
ncbi:MAG: aminoacyl-tRNA hydrolase [Gammaproteobacteria bacterium]|nr:aminoacyl-tRNA hydrolase [Gammaproteobacteria bacterium]